MASKNKENTEVETQLSEPVVAVDKVHDFKQAFRIFKISNPIFAKYDSEAVETFCNKRLKKKEATMKEWASVLEKY